jgi:filamentous hemagglutinin family protein
MPAVKSKQLHLFFVAAAFVLPVPVGHAQTPITSSGLDTQVHLSPTAPSGKVQYDITAGTRSGANLFHSFGEFGIPANHIANFLNDSGLTTSNILGRVTGGNPSNIFGTLKTTGFDSANLFLMNPAGIVFGPNASLNVGGSVSFTTADYLRLADGAQFRAIPGPQDASISSAPVAAFGFLGSNPAAITVQSAGLAVSDGQTISLVGGDITIEGATPAINTGPPAGLSARGGQINLASVASPGEILYPTLRLEPNGDGQSFTNMGTIALSEGATLDVSANAAGTVKIRGGRFMMDRATISADTMNTDGAPIAIDIDVIGNVSITAVDNPALTAKTAGTGDAGEVRILSGNMDVTATTLDNFTFAVADTHTSGTGKAGKIDIATGDLTVRGDLAGLTFLADSGTTGEGSGGDIALTAQTLLMDTALISTGDNNLGLSESGSLGKAGNISIATGNLDLTFSSLAAESQTLGQGGDITIHATDIHLNNSPVSATGMQRAGTITIHTDTLVSESSLIESSIKGSGPAGGISITGKEIQLTEGSQLLTTTLADGDAGPIRVIATEQLDLSGTFFGLRPSGIFSNSGFSGGALGTVGSHGNAGSISIETPRLDITGGARINTATLTGGSGGNVTINANSISLSGQLQQDPLEPIFAVGNQLAGGIFTKTIGSELCTTACGNAGLISISTNTVAIGNGSHIDSGTSSNGRGGDITIHAADTITLSGTLSNGTPAGIFSRTVGTEPRSGAGGNISLTAGQSVSLSNGASISASSTGPANAGNITINAGAQFMSQNGKVKTDASQASGGNITVQATDSIRLVNSQINTSVEGGPNTAGGNITIDPAIMTLQNSQILAQANRGQGGNINITAGTFLADQTSRVDASAREGISGTVNIQSPVSSLSGTLAALPQRPLQVHSLLSQRCAAQASGRLSSLVVAGRDRLPAEPGGLMISPLAWTPDETPARQTYMVPPDLAYGLEGPSIDRSKFLPHLDADGCGPS